MIDRLMENESIVVYDNLALGKMDFLDYHRMLYLYRRFYSILTIIIIIHNMNILYSSISELGQ